jgi:hypothetical protein
VPLIGARARNAGPGRYPKTPFSYGLKRKETLGISKKAIAKIEAARTRKAKPRIIRGKLSESVFLDERGTTLKAAFFLWLGSK